jgi:MoaA/NifB/PqqE/SkfB family radical SAM enzyme
MLVINELKTFLRKKIRNAVGYHDILSSINGLRVEYPSPPPLPAAQVEQGVLHGSNNKDLWWGTPREREQIVIGDRPELNDVRIRDQFSLGENLFAPRTLNIETINVCNFKCVFCPSASIKRSAITMNMDLFKKILIEHKNIGGHSLVINPVLGDVFLDKLLAERMKTMERIFASNEVDVILLGNGLAAENWTDADLHLIVSPLAVMMFSVYGLDEEEHDAITRTANTYERTINQIKRIIDICNKRSIKVVLLIRALKANVESRAAIWLESIFGKNWQTIVGVKEIMSSYGNPAGLLDSSLPLPFDGKWWSAAQILHKYDFNYCPIPITGHKVMANGDLIFCKCWQNSKDNILGNVSEKSLLELYNSNQAKHLWKIGPEQCQKCDWGMPHGLEDYIEKTFYAHPGMLYRQEDFDERKL